jgi:tRNA(Met) C34 N-acetyltransferase TmcA
MWYKISQTGFGGGIFNPIEFAIQQQMLKKDNKDKQDDSEILHHNPIEEATSAYEQRLWDTIVNKTDSITSDNYFDNPDSNREGVAVEAEEARRLSPYHKNPEETTMEEQLEAVRQENVNSDLPESMSSTEGARGELLVRGDFPYISGKGWTGYEDLPSDKSWA